MPGHLTRLFTHVGENRRLYARLLGPDASARFAARLRELFTDAWHLELRDRPVTGDFLAGALTGVILGWATDPTPAPAAEIATQFWQLAARTYR